MPSYSRNKFILWVYLTFVCSVVQNLQIYMPKKIISGFAIQWTYICINPFLINTF